MFDPKSQPRLALGRAIAAALIWLALGAVPALADQSSLCLPTTGTLTGLTAVTSINAAFKALVTMASGSSAPTNDCTGAPVKGQLWLDTSAAPNIWKAYDGIGWETIGVTDGTSHIFRAPVGAGLNNIASAATTDLWSLPDNYLSVTGTTPITKLAGSGAAGIKFFTIVSAGLALTQNATQLILPGAANIVSQAGDKGIAVALGGGNVAVLAYTRADGTALSANSTIATNFVLSGDITPSVLSATTNNWSPAGLATASTVRLSASTTVNLTGIAAQGNGTWLLLQNIGANAVTLTDSSGSSSAANRFNLGGDYLLSPLGSIVLRYDGTTSRWLAASAVRPIATQLQATTGTDNASLMTPLRSAQAIAALAPVPPTSNQQVFTTAGTATWTKPATGTTVLAQCWGAGGSGAQDSLGGNGGGGGGGGAYSSAWFTLSALGATETVTIGAGGASISANGNGNPGGNSSFGTWITGYGGGGGGGGSGANSGGGGGGQGSAGASGSGATPGAGGTDLAGGTGEGAGGGGGPGLAVGTPKVSGGGGGAGGSDSGGAGGKSGFGGGGGGGGGGPPSAGGPSKFGGNGGAGATNGAATAGSQPGGGGGGLQSAGTSGKGGDGECIATTF